MAVTITSGKSSVLRAAPRLMQVLRVLARFRVMQTNALRGFLYEFGQVLPEGHLALAGAWPAALAALSEQLPAMLFDSLREQWARVQGVEAGIAALERRQASALRATGQCRLPPFRESVC